MRIERSTQVVQAMLDFMNHVVTANDGPGNNIGMPIEILGATVQRDIEAPFGWTEIDRAGKRVVD